MGRAIFIGERSDGLAAIGMLVSECGAEQQEWARGREGGQGGRTLSLPHGHPSAQPISSVSQPDALLSASVLPPQPLPLPQKQLGKQSRDGWKHLPLCTYARDEPSDVAVKTTIKYPSVVSISAHSLDLTSQKKGFFSDAAKFSLGHITFVLSFCTYFVQNWKLWALFCTVWPEPAAKAIVLLLITHLWVWTASADPWMPIFSCFGSAHSYLSYAHITSLWS